MAFNLFSGDAPVRVQPFFGYRSAHKLMLSVRALRGDAPEFEPRGFWRGFKTMIRQYASLEVAGLDVRLTFETGAGHPVAQTATTDAEGFAHFSVELGAAHARPMNTAWERAAVSWQDESGAAREAAALILAPGKTAGMGIISDIDDTIVETGITGNAKAILRNWKRVMVQMPGERVVVPGAPEFYTALGGEPAITSGPATAAGVPQARLKTGPKVEPKNGPKTGPRPVFYVSSSPWNLFSYLTAFKQQSGMPMGPIALRDWGLNRKTLGSEGHGSHKEIAIEKILAAFPDLAFVLVGDDTQKDMAVFGKIGAAFPDRIAAVFIRRISKEPLDEAERHAKAGLDAAGVPLWTGADYDAARLFLADAGLGFDARVEALVKTASEGSPREKSDQ